ncbi:MAG: hypothetical protein ABSA40_06885 [Candidatus Dormibacteria bacterium]
MSDLTCASAAVCWGLGRENGTTVFGTFRGGAWTSLGTPAAGDEVAGLACPSPTACWVVGGTAAINNDANNQQPLIASYGAGAWSRTVLPAVSGGGTLAAIVCPDATQCWAVGNADLLGALIYEYVGGNWIKVTVPSQLDGAAALLSVGCSGSDACWAVGYDGHPVILHLAHESVTASVTSSIGQAGGSFQGVACQGTDDCWAVGVSGGQALAAQYTVGAWSAATSSLSSGGVSATSILDGIACTAADCWAVGSTTTGSGVSMPLLEHVTGSSWALTTSPTVSGGSELGWVTCGGVDQCWAGGGGDFSSTGYPTSGILDTDT